MARRVHLTFDLATEDPGAALFLQEALERGLTRLVRDHWQTTAKLDTAGAAWAQTDSHAVAALFHLPDDVLALVRAGFGGAFAHVAAGSDEAAQAAMEHVRGLLPRAIHDREGRVPVTFWSYGLHGPMPMGRTLSVPTWEEIAPNYGEATGAALARLMSGELPWRGGQLILWHGETGTGKTTALRALAREWSSWCAPHYITDPEKFFGGQSDYMLSVMLEHESAYDDGGDEGFTAYGGSVVGGMAMSQTTVFLPGGGHGADPDREPPWRLLILEDTGELLSADARMQAGQGLSRFLNVVDGLIGQGLRILVLVTTNEEIGRLHPAVARPGRCAANVLFSRLPVDRANEWLRERKSETTVTEPQTLAALYAALEGWSTVAERQATGFG